MKKQSFKTFLAVAVMSAAGPVVVSADTSVGTSVERSMNFRISPISLLAGEFGLDADFRVSDSFTIGPSISTLKAALLFVEMSGLNMSARGNWYLSDTAIKSGWYLGPSVGYSTRTVSFVGQEGSAGAFTIGTLIGYQWVMNSGLNINVGGGGSYYMGDDAVTTANNSTISVPWYKGFVPQIEVTLGYAF